MKKNYLTALVIGTVLSLGVYTVSLIGQQPAAAPAAAPLPNLVAVVDVAQLIKNHPDFKAKQTALQDKVKQAEAQFTARQQAIIAKQKALEASQFKAGTPEHEQQLKAIANEAAVFDTDAKTMQRQFALENSKIMHEVYQDIRKTIAAYASSRNIAQVIDYREFESDPAKPQSVAEDMDRPLVWYYQRLNITQFILNAMYQARGITAKEQIPVALIGEAAKNLANTPAAPVNPAVNPAANPAATRPASATAPTANPVR